ncbi:MAG TPA: FkbM family methyltransferase [Acidimicrobiales bacterium]|nr:FkbM family methyltransferase [Acidimicrobiales bacterium]
MRIIPPALTAGGRWRRVLGAARTFAVGLAFNRGGRRMVLRRAFFDLAHYATPVVAVQSNGLTYYLNTGDHVVSRETFVAGDFEEAVMAGALAVLERYGHKLRGRTFVDIGANLGTSTIPAVARFGASHALAVEPEPTNYELLRCNVLANGLEGRVTTVRAAISDTTGTGQLGLSTWNSGDHRVWVRNERALDVEPLGRSMIDIDLWRLDDLLVHLDIDWSSVGVVWVDCQGHEGYVLKGAPRLTASAVPVISEYWPYGLRLGGDLELFHSIVAECYDTVIDARDLLAEGHTSGVPASEVGTLETLYPDRSFTDLILLKDRPASS